MAKKLKHLHCDFESASCADLKKTGASRYAADPTTIVLCVAWAWDDSPDVRSWTMPKLKDLKDLLDEADVLHAWNASFELAILKHRYGINFPFEKVSCSMQRSLYGGLPASLDMAGRAVRLDPRLLKSPDGHRLMMKMCKPRTGKGTWNGTFWHADPVVGQQMLVDLAAYCRQDVISERAMSNLIPALPQMEKDISLMDRNVNAYGVRLDPYLIDAMTGMAKEETHRLDRQCSILTNGVVTSPGTQTDRLTNWFASQGWPVEDIGKETIAETLELAVDAEMPAEIVEVMSIRQRVAKSSVKKLAAMANSMEADGCVRGSLQYYGAGRTGRWAGRLIQLHNMPRPMKGLDVAAAIDDIRAFTDVDQLRLFHGEPLNVISSCLRGCILPVDPSKSLLVYDFSQIEARVIAWLGGQQALLDEFESGRDVYTYTSNQLGLGSRAAGKIAVLGLGFGMGKDHFVDFAKKNGLVITPLESETIVTAWRNTNTGIVDFWGVLDIAIKSMIRFPGGGMGHAIGGLALRMGKGKNGDPLLTICLPSGRSLFYRNSRIEKDDKGRDSIVYDGIDQYTKKWGKVRSWGAKFAENITQAIARDIMAVAARRVLADPAFAFVNLLLSVHDELVFEGDLENLWPLKAVIEDVPVWAPGLPIKCDAKAMSRYAKM